MEATLIQFKHKKPEAVKALLMMLVLIGLFFGITSSSIIGFVLSTVGIFFLVIDNAMIVDLDNKRYRQAILFRDKATGRWKSLPEVSYVSVFVTTMVSTSHSITYRSIVMKEKVVMVNLIYDKHKRLNIYQSKDREEAIEKAALVARKLDVRIFDATTRDGKWVEFQHIKIDHP